MGNRDRSWSEPVPLREFHQLESSAFHGALLRQLNRSVPGGSWHPPRRRKSYEAASGIRWILDRLFPHFLKKGIHVERQPRLGNSCFHPFHRYGRSDL
jgi:hypothetical protein